MLKYKETKNNAILQTSCIFRKYGNEILNNLYNE